MKNEVFGLHSLRKYSDGRIEKDGTLLFPSLEKAESFLAGVNKMNATGKPHIRDSFIAQYEMDQTYIVNNFIAENVHTKKAFFVSQIHRHLEGYDDKDTPHLTINVVGVDFKDEDTNVIDVDVTEVDNNTIQTNNGE